MEGLLSQEAVLDRKLNQLELRKKAELERLSSGIGARKEWHGDAEEAAKRNATFLQELCVFGGRLHTQRLCPLNEKVRELREDFLHPGHTRHHPATNL